MSREPSTRCPCLYSEAAPICRADADAMRVPSADQLARLCRSRRYRSCELFRGFLGSLAAEPTRWREAAQDPPAPVTTVTVPGTKLKGDRT